MTTKNRSLRTLDLSALDAVAGGTGLSGILHFGVANQFAEHGASGAPGAPGAPTGIQAAPEVAPAANDSDWGAFDLPDVDTGWDLSELDSGIVPAGGGSFENDIHAT